MTPREDARTAAAAPSARRAPASVTPATTTTPTTSPPDQATPSAPPREAVEVRAYYLWEKSGTPDPVANWLEAERQLRDEYELGRTTRGPTQAQTNR